MHECGMSGSHQRMPLLRGIVVQNRKIGHGQELPHIRQRAGITSPLILLRHVMPALFYSGLHAGYVDLNGGSAHKKYDNIEPHILRSRGHL